MHKPFLCKWIWFGFYFYCRAAETIELYIGEFLGEQDGTAGDSSTSNYSNKIDLDKAHFILLGHVTMARNDSTGFKARELKSISVECRGSLVKLLIQNNYTNKYNRNQQQVRNEWIDFTMITFSYLSSGSVDISVSEISSNKKAIYLKYVIKLKVHTEGMNTEYKNNSNQHDHHLHHPHEKNVIGNVMYAWVSKRTSGKSQSSFYLSKVVSSQCIVPLGQSKEKKAFVIWHDFNKKSFKQLDLCENLSLLLNFTILFSGGSRRHKSFGRETWGWRWDDKVRIPNHIWGDEPKRTRSESVFTLWWPRFHHVCWYRGAGSREKNGSQKARGCFR